MGAPDVGQLEAKAVYEQVLSGWISQGKRTQEFEKKISDFINVNYSQLFKAKTTSSKKKRTKYCKNCLFDS